MEPELQEPAAVVELIIVVAVTVIATLHGDIRKKAEVIAKAQVIPITIRILQINKSKDEKG